MSGPVEPGRRIGRRRRRLYWTVGLLLGAAVAGGAIGAWILQANRVEGYRPGEELAAITQRLDLGIPEEAPAPRFVDVTAAAGLDGFRAFAGDRTSQLPEDMGSGAAWGDFDGDGDDDLFLVSQGGPLGAAESARARSRLYENLGAGRFGEVVAFPETRILGMGAAWGDFDGDGALDLIVAGYDALRLFRNRDGVLVPDSAIGDRPGYWSGVSWADFDRDGDLDLYVCGYVDYVEDPRGAERTTQQYGRAVPYTLNPASFEPSANLLFRNLGGGRFEEVAAELGVDNPQGRSLGALWHDLDGDGWLDLYVANDISDNALFVNREGSFEDISHPAWVADYRGAMGLTAGDWNRDGDDDLFVTHWIAQENALYDSLLQDLKDRPAGGEGAAVKGPAPQSSVRFMDVADQRGLGQVALQMIGWGAEFVDLDADGWLDLVVVNGSTFETDTAPRRLRRQKPFLFWNRQGRSFHDLAPLSGPFSVARVSRGLALADYDRDGDVDVLIVDRDGGARLLRNDMERGNWLALRLLRGPGEVLEGTRVEAATDTGVVLRRSLAGVSYLSQSSSLLHLGLGEGTRLDSVDVYWAGGGEPERFGPLAAGAIWELGEGGVEPLRIDAAPQSGADAAAGAGTDAGAGARPGRAGGPALTKSASAAPTDRAQLAEFWRLQRAAMQAVKIDADPRSAIPLFEAALELNPTHSDSLYYLGNCLAETGDVDGALERFSEIMEFDPQSHRAHKRWGTLRAMSAGSPEQLDEAARMLERASQINREETGVPLVLGEVELMRGDPAAARRRFEWVIGSNPQSGEAFFMLAYLDWREGQAERSVERLGQALGTRSEDWKPSGVVAEGETKRKMYVESAPLLRFYESWTGTTDLAEAFGGLDARLRPAD